MGGSYIGECLGGSVLDIVFGSGIVLNLEQLWDLQPCPCIINIVILNRGAGPCTGKPIGKQSDFQSFLIARLPESSHRSSHDTLNT